jgi:hypothetical protein
MDLFLNLWNILKDSLIYIFVRYLSYSLLKIHRNFRSGYLLGDKASLRNVGQFRTVALQDSCPNSRQPHGNNYVESETWGDLGFNG